MRGVAAALVASARPRQWSKNLVVLSALLFALEFRDGVSVLVAVAAMLLFTATSGGHYVLNDVIDVFLEIQRKQNGLSASPEADNHTLIRRLSLDLTGLPPTLEEVDRFIADNNPDSYPELVDRLLAKPAFGEHWARMWLDLARYADSSGYADDPARTIWAYRDYVISAFNQNKPFNQFTIEQIAGDLLEKPTTNQRRNPILC